MMAKSVVAPIDRSKILFQVTNEPYKLSKVPKLMSSIVKSSGMSALWKGNGAQMLRIFPYAGIQFATFDFLKNTSLSSNPSKKTLSGLESMLFGGIAAV